MAVSIAEVAATGRLDLEEISERFLAWAEEASDIGIQTRKVLSAVHTGADVSRAAQNYFQRHPENSAGNGSLMRTAPVALAHLGDDQSIGGRQAGLSVDPRRPAGG